MKRIIVVVVVALLVIVMGHLYNQHMNRVECSAFALHQTNILGMEGLVQYFNAYNACIEAKGDSAFKPPKEKKE